MITGCSNSRCFGPLSQAMNDLHASVSLNRNFLICIRKKNPSLQMIRLNLKFKIRLLNHNFCLVEINMFTYRNKKTDILYGTWNRIIKVTVKLNRKSVCILLFLIFFAPYFSLAAPKPQYSKNLYPKPIQQHAAKPDKQIAKKMLGGNYHVQPH